MIITKLKKKMLSLLTNVVTNNGIKNIGEFREVSRHEIFKSLFDSNLILSYVALTPENRELEAHFHDTDSYVIIVKGKGRGGCDKIKFSFQDGDICYIPRYALHRFEMIDAKGFEAIAIQYTDKSIFSEGLKNKTFFGSNNDLGIANDDHFFRKSSRRDREDIFRFLENKDLFRNFKLRWIKVEKKISFIFVKSTILFIFSNCKIIIEGKCESCTNDDILIVNSEITIKDLEGWMLVLESI